MTDHEGCVLDCEALIEGYLLGRVPREQLLSVVGAEELDAIEYQRDALRQDVIWGLNVLPIE
jgi:hypothetical protein